MNPREDHVAHLLSLPAAVVMVFLLAVYLCLVAVGLVALVWFVAGAVLEYRFRRFGY